MYNKGIGIKEFERRWRAQLNCAGRNAVRENVINESPPTKYLEKIVCGLTDSGKNYI